MKPKEKAKDLIEKFEPFADYTECDVFTQRENMLKNAIQCALIAVNEIIDAIDKSLINSDIEYWQEVKNEINKL